jgi:hypothetical protein
VEVRGGSRHVRALRLEAAGRGPGALDACAGVARLGRERRVDRARQRGFESRVAQLTILEHEDLAREWMPHPEGREGGTEFVESRRLGVVAHRRDRREHPVGECGRGVRRQGALDLLHDASLLQAACREPQRVGRLELSERCDDTEREDDERRPDDRAEVEHQRAPGPERPIVGHGAPW